MRSPRGVEKKAAGVWMRVSVVITTRHRGELRPRAVESVLPQTSPGLKLMLIGDGSTITRPAADGRPARDRDILADPVNPQDLADRRTPGLSYTPGSAAERCS